MIIYFRKNTYNIFTIDLAIFILLVFLSIFTSAQAHSLKAWEQKANSEIQWIQQNLLVNSKQIEQVKSMNISFYYKNDSLDRLRDQKLKKRLQTELKKDKDAKFKFVLDEHQYEQYLIHTGSDYTQYKSPFKEN